MEMRLTDIEANTVRHALESYKKTLKDVKDEKGAKFEAEAIESVVKKLMQGSGASGT